MPVMTTAQREEYASRRAQYDKELKAHDAENSAAVQTAKRIDALRESYSRGAPLSTADRALLFPTSLDARGKPRSF